MALDPYDPRRSNMESDSDLVEAALLQELAKARGSLMTIQSLLERGSFQAAKELAEKTVAEMRPVHVRRTF